jgi:hypothetical protein
VHDLFEILGLPTNAAASEVRRAARRPRRIHPDFEEAAVPATPAASPRPAGPAPDVAIDFVSIATVIDRVRTAFFEAGS